MEKIFKSIALVFGTIVTIINSIDVFYNYGALWVKNSVTLSKLRALKREVNFYSAGCKAEELSESKINKYMNTLDQILTEDMKQWLSIREKSNSLEQNSEKAIPTEIKFRSSLKENAEEKTQ